MNIILIESSIAYADEIWKFRQEVLDFDDVYSGVSWLDQVSDVQE